MLILSSFVKALLVSQFIAVQAVSIMERPPHEFHPWRSIKEKTRQANDWYNDRAPKFLSPKAWKFKAQASMIPENYNYDLYTKNEFFDVGFSSDPKKRTKHVSKANFLSTGEDNFFITACDSSPVMAVGVTSSISTWLTIHHDSSSIARELCHSTKSVFESSADKTSLNAKELIEMGFDDLDSKKDKHTGATAPLVGIFKKESVDIALLGHSWAGLYRNAKLIKHTEIDAWRSPSALWQLDSNLERKLDKTRIVVDDIVPSKIFEDTKKYLWDIKSGDIVVFATDGLIDALTTSLLGPIIGNAVEKESDPQTIAGDILVNARKAPKHGTRYDDMTVLVVKVL